MNLLVMALGPVIAIFFFFRAKDRYEKEPLGRLLLTFAIGAASALPVVLIGFLWASGLDDITSMTAAQISYMAFIQVALTEEVFKAVAFYSTSYWSKHFNEPYDGIMYAVSASLGFAAVENILYVLRGGLYVAIVRALTAVPAHAMFGLFTGYFAGRAKFTKYPWAKPFLMITGLLLAILSHGFYDFIAFSGTAFDPLINLGLVPLLVFMLVISLVLIRNARKLSPFIPEIDAEGRYTGYTVSGRPLTSKEAKRFRIYPGKPSGKEPTTTRVFTHTELLVSDEEKKNNEGVKPEVEKEKNSYMDTYFSSEEER